jgi:RND family efflux transporter MFP subunit
VHGNAVVRFVVVAIVLGLGACRGAAAPPEPAEAPPPAEVTCQAITTSAVDEVIELAGVIAPPPRLDAVLSSPIAGRVAQVAVEEGDQVAAGALLATVEDPALAAGSVESRAAVASARATKDAADGEAARQARLFDSGIAARRELDEARTKATAAAAELQAADARAGLASTQLARRELRAPRAGIVLHLWRRAGESVDGTAATPIAEVADLSVLEVRAQVAPRSLVRLRERLGATIHLVGVDAPITATVVRVAPAVDPATLLGTVRLQLAATQTRPPVGSAATARVVIAQHPGLLVPAAALRRATSGTDELVVCEGELAKVRSVTIGQRPAGAAEILTGLAAGDQVVVDHVLGLEDGRRLVRGKAKP